MSNVTVAEFGNKGGIIMADSSCVSGDELNFYAHSKLFQINNSVAGYIGRVDQAEAPIKSCQKLYRGNDVVVIADKLSDIANTKKKENFTEMYLKPQKIKFDEINSKVYKAFIQFYEADYLLTGFHKGEISTFIIGKHHDDGYFSAHETYWFSSLGCGDQVIENSLTNSINRTGFPENKENAYRILLEAFDKIKMRHHISRPYDSYLLENNRAKNIPRQLNELNSKLFELADARIINEDILEESINRTLRQKSFDSVADEVISSLRGNQKAVIKHLFATPNI